MMLIWSVMPIGSGWTAEWPDPTQADGEPTPRARQHCLTMTMVTPSRTVAELAGELVEVGTTVFEARVEEITPRWVAVTVQGERRLLRVGECW